MSIKTLNNPSEKEILSYLELGVPFKVLGRMEKWPLMKKWNYKYFKKNFGKNMIGVKDLSIKSDNPERFKMIIDDYIEYLESDDQSKLYYASDISIESLSKDLFKDYDMDFIKKFDIFRNYVSNELRWVFLGKKGTYTGLHLDIYSTAAWLGLISGRKRFYFFNPFDSEKIKIFSDKFDGLNLNDLSGEYKSFFDSLNPEVIDLLPGEIVFTPNNYYHYVINLEDSIALTENFSHKSIEKEVLKNFYYSNDIFENIYFFFIYHENYFILIFIIIFIIYLYNRFK